MATSTEGPKSRGGSTAAQPTPVWVLILYLVGYKVVFFLFVLASIDLLPHTDTMGVGRLHFPSEADESRWIDHFVSPDTQSYVRLAREGYEKGSPDCAFYPMLPLLIRVGSSVTPLGPLAAGLVVVNLLSLGGLAFFFSMVERYHGPDIAIRALILMLAFPGAFFFNVVLTEGVFLLFIGVFFWALFAKRYWLAGLSGFFLPLTKAVGIFSVLPLAWWLWTQKDRGWSWAALLGPVSGYALYFTIMGVQTGNPVEGFEAQRHYANQPSIANMFNPVGFVEAFFRDLGLAGGSGRPEAAVDWGVFGIVLASLVKLYRIDRTYFIYALFTGLVPALSLWMISYSRQVMVVIPLFVALALTFHGLRPTSFLYFVGAAGALQILLLIRYTHLE